MKILLHTILLLIIFFLIQPTLKAQDKENDPSYYFQDKGISSSKNIIKMDLLSLLRGNVGLNYERVLNKTLTIESGLGLRVGYFFPDFTLPYMGQPEIFQGSALTFMIQPKFYFYRAPERKYVGICYQLTRFSQLQSHDYTIQLGTQLIKGKRLIMDAAFGFGIRFQDVEIEPPFYNPGKDFFLVFPLNFKIGYLLN
jgi:hypothetical protein